MKKYWFTSDTHFGHENVLRHSQRPFASLKEMDDQLVYNWNVNVMPEDDVYHLGDFAWHDAATYRAALNGHIFKIKGNHHHAAKKIADLFEWVKDVHEIKIPYEKAPFGVCDCSFVAGDDNATFHHHQCASSKPVRGNQRIFLSHYSHRVWPRMHHGVWHLYGHSHGNLADAGDLSMDVGVDAVARYLVGISLGARDSSFEEVCGMKVLPADYRPISFEEIRTIMSYRNFVARDHHTGSEVGA